MTIDPTFAIPPAQGIPPVGATVKPRTPDDSELAARWIVHNRNVAFGIGEWRKYEDGYWKIIERDIIKSSIKATLDRARIDGVRPNAAQIASVMECARVDIVVPVEKWDTNTEYLPCANGVLHIPTKTLLPHTPDIYATSRLNFDYDPTATCPNFLHALEVIPDAAEFLQEFAGYALTPDVKHEIAVWMQGPPGSGKSTVLAGLQAMLGIRAGLLGLADIEKSRFGLADLPGKTLVVSTEQPDNYISTTDTLNKIISGEPISVERKFREAVTVIPRAKIIWAMNNLPRVNDANNGLMRRVKIIKFPALEESLRDLDLKEKIMQEGAGILNWALIGLDRLLLRGGFAIPKTILDATREFQEKNDIPAMFLADVNASIDLLDPNCREQSQTLYDRYNDWCRRNNHKPLSSVKVADEWRRLGFEKIKIRGVFYWQGVQIPVPGIGVVP